MTDPRITAFCSPRGPEVFHSVCHRHDIWKPDPFDVPAIHREARETFERLVHQATTPPGTTAGRILLILGEAGSGKTHLMRAFRNSVHGNGAGYCGYMQMTTATDNYGRYVLSNLVDSLDQPYDEQTSGDAGLTRLSNALAESLPPDDLERLRNGEFSDAELGHFTNVLADVLLGHKPLADIDGSLIRSLLYLQRDEPRIKSRVLRYLRCEDLSTYDRAVLGDMVPRHHDIDPQRTVEQLGRLMWAVQQVPLVLFVDQLEDIYNLDANLEGAQRRFRQAISCLCAVATNVPSSILVVSCLEDFYTSLKNSLAASHRFRLEEEAPSALVLAALRTSDEAIALVAQRLSGFFEEMNVDVDPADPTFPIPAGVIYQHAHTKTRFILDWCRQLRDQAVRDGKLPEDAESQKEDRSERDAEAQAGALAAETGAAESAATGIDQQVLDLEAEWNDFLAQHESQVPDDESELAALLAWSLERCGDEMQNGTWFEVAPDGHLLPVEVHREDNAVERMLVAVCNKAPQGGHLARQIEEVERRAGEIPPVLVRSTQFYKTPSSKIAKQLGELVRRGGRRVVVEDSHWRRMLALRDFRAQQQERAGFQQWLKQEMPLSQMPPLQEILALGRPQDQPESLSSSSKPRQVRAVERRRVEPLPDPRSLQLGELPGHRAHAAEIPLGDLTRHAAFLGSSGSGKTTMALNVVEQLILRNIPVVLVDRKGDLAGYVARQWTADAQRCPRLARRREELERQMEVALYTPGNPEGRPLSIGVVPDGIAHAPEHERLRLAGSAAAALAGMLGYRDTTQQRQRVTILTQAIRVLAELEPDLEMSLDALIDFIESEDPVLIEAIGRLDLSNCSRLITDLETLRLGPRGDLFASGQERLNVGSLLNPAAADRNEKTRLSIISTKFLGDTADVLFWIAQLLNELTRWADQRPAAELQAVILFDEADIYLPAQSKPATKSAFEHLLKRARSAGIGLMLATQSPGDLDYKCRDNILNWFVGKVKETTALNKLKSEFQESGVDLSARLPAQEVGQFYWLRAGKARRLLAERSLLDTRQLPEEEILRLATAR